MNHNPLGYIPPDSRRNDTGMPRLTPPSGYIPPDSRRNDTGYGYPPNAEANFTPASVQPTQQFQDLESRRNDTGNDNKDRQKIVFSDSRRFAVNKESTNDVILKSTYYYHDTITQTLNLVEENEKGKTKITPLTSAFSISNVTYIREIGNPNIKYVRIDSHANRHHCVFMKYDDFVNERFYQYMKWIKKCPGCTKKQFNDLVYNLIQTACKDEAEIFPRQGFIKINENDYIFGSFPENMPDYSVILSDSVKMKRLMPFYREAQEIVQRWLDIYASHPTLKFLGLISIAAKLKFILEENEVTFKPIIVVSPSAELDEEKLKAILYSFDVKNYPVPSLSLSEKGMLAYLSNIWDSPAVFSDNSFSDETAKIEESLRNLMKVSCGDYGEANTGRNIIAVISKNAGYIAHRISPESVISLSTEGIKLDYSNEYIRKVTSEMEALVIGTELRRISFVRNLASSMIEQGKDNRHIFPTEEALNSAIYMMTARRFLRDFLDVNLVSDEEMKQINRKINEQRNALVDSDTAILRDFAKVASDKFRSGSFKAIRKKNGMIINDTGNTAIISGNRVYLTGEMIAEVLSEMSTTHNLKALMCALAHYNVLDEKDGRTHPLDAHNSSGKAVRLYLYDISDEILDADILYTFNNLECSAYMLSEQEVPKTPFLPLLRDINGGVAGKVIDYNEEDNDHMLICGQSGFGKSYLQAQLIAKRFSLGNKVVAFDTSDSFTYKALCKNLPKSFVDENVTFYNIDSSVIPINIFHVDDTLGKASKIKYLVGIFKAGIGELSVPQSNALRSILDEVLSNPSEEGFPQQMLKALDDVGKGTEKIDERTIMSLRNRLEPLLGDIIECGMSEDTWGDFLASHKPIVIIHTEGINLDNNNQVIDMLLLTLFSYQNEDFTIPLDIFIDEIQNQNFSNTSSIRRIMKEGRKIHMSFFGSTQDYYPKKTELGSTMGKAGTQIFLRPSEDSEQAVAAELRWKKADMARFDAMDRGDIIVKGALYNKKKGRNTQTTLSGHVDDFLPNEIIYEADEEADIADDKY